jgi:Tfp pilus assembly protein PilF
VIVAVVLVAGALAAADCGQLVRHEAGGDYTDAVDRKSLAVIEQFHFTAEVESLRRGVSDKLGGDIGYTLEHFPNHHRALAAMARLALRDKTRKVPGARYCVDCYFERALQFKDSDAVVRSYYGSYLLASGRTDAALAQMREAARLDPLDATTHYNLGLLFAKNKDYPEARKHARQAYRLGFPLPGLKNRLVEARQWEAEDETASNRRE